MSEFDTEEKRYRIVYETSPLAFVIWDRETRVVDWNREAEKLFGWRRGEVLGRSWWEFLIPEGARGPVEDVVASLLADQLPNRSVNENLTRDGRRLTIEWSNSVLRGPDGEVAGAISLGLDRTGLVEKEAALHRHVEFQRMVARLSARFINLPPEAIDDAIASSVNELAPFLAADRCGLYHLVDTGATLALASIWARDPSFLRREVVERIPVSSIPWAVGRLRTGNPIVVPRTDELQHEARGLRRLYESLRAESALFVPMVTRNGFLGGFSLTTIGRTRDWEPDTVGLVELVGQIFANALDRKSSEETLREALEENARLRDRLEAENTYLRTEIDTSSGFEGLVGRSPAFRETLLRVDQVAGTDASVLILGETGTGKELIARSVHARSLRSDRPLVKVNCAALPGPLIEAELFGHEKGAFTGASEERAGRFELADGGTIFLDEVGDLPVALQAKLLRVLQEGEFERLGSSRVRRTDVRVIAATNRDLGQAIRTGAFRADLYYRLSVFPIHVPPLRERRGDVELLVRHFVKGAREHTGLSIERVSNEALAQLESYGWPGNVRELRNVVERALILSDGPVLDLREFPRSESGLSPDHGSLKLADVERAHILRVIEESGWKIWGKGNAAERLGLNPSTLRSRMKKLEIERPATR